MQMLLSVRLHASAWNAVEAPPTRCTTNNSCHYRGKIKNKNWKNRQAYICAESESAAQNHYYWEQIMIQTEKGALYACYS